MTCSNWLYDCYGCQCIYFGMPCTSLQTMPIPLQHSTPDHFPTRIYLSTAIRDLHKKKKKRAKIMGLSRYLMHIAEAE